MGVDITAIRQAILSMVKDNNRLAQCTTRSICEAVAKAVYLGLDLSPAAPEGIEAVITAIRQDDRLDHEEKTELFNAATARKRELAKRKHSESVA